MPIRPTSILAVATLMLATGACTSLIEVEAPSRVAAEGLDHPSNANLLVNSVGADYECALAGYIVAAGLVGNELEIGSTGIAVKEYDKRDFNPSASLYSTAACTGLGVYKPLQTARYQGDNTTRLLEGWSDSEVADRQQLIATASTYAGYSLLLLGESMCSAAIDVGPEITPAQMFQEAESRFTKALTAAQGNADLTNWARVGRARARLRQGNASAAATDAQSVPVAFVKTATYSTEVPRRENLVWVNGHRNRLFVIDPSYRGLTFNGVDDPRVNAVPGPVATASDGVTPLWITNKYGSASASIPLATGVEALLIVAEAAGGQAAVDIINELHDRVGLPHFSSSDPAAIQAQLVEERRRTFFLEGHHIGDVRQYNLALTPAPGVPFKDGGGTYRDQKCFPLPDNERLNNPNINN